VRRAAGVTVAGLAVVLLAFTFDAGPLFIVGIAFAVLGVAMPTWVWASAQRTVALRQLLRDRVVEGEPVEATIEITRARWGAPGAELRDALLQTPVSIALPLSLIPGPRSAQLRIVTRFARRGLWVLDPPEMLVTDPLGLASYPSRRAGPRQELLVLPYTEPVRWRHARGSRRGAGAGGSTAAEPFAATDVDGLRPYRVGTPASRIHWAALARGAGLLERRLRADGDERPVVVLDARGTGPIEYLDAAVRAAASLTLELARLGGCRLLLPGDRRAVTIEPDLANWPRLHVRLALVQGGHGAPAPRLELGSRLGAVFYVAARATPQPPQVLCGNHRGSRVLVLPTALAGAAAGSASFEVAGCSGVIVRARSARPDPVAA
jgi:uncharacterized protein (DUF58 family)